MNKQIQNQYSIRVLWSPEDGEFVALVDEFPGLSALAPTREQALLEAELLLPDFEEIHRQQGHPLPKPKVAKNDFSGQIRLRLPKSLHAELARIAEEDGVSLNTYMVALLAKGATRAY